MTPPVAAPAVPRGRRPGGSWPAGVHGAHQRTWPAGRFIGHQRFVAHRQLDALNRGPESQSLNGALHADRSPAAPFSRDHALRYALPSHGIDQSREVELILLRPTTTIVHRRSIRSARPRVADCSVAVDQPSGLVPHLVRDHGDFTRTRRPGRVKLQVSPMDLMVVERAQEDAAIHVGTPVVSVPPVEVMHFAPPSVHPAAGPGAVPIPGHDRATPRPGEDPFRPSYVQRPALGIDHQPRHCGVAHRLGQLAAGHGTPVLEGRRPDPRP